MLRVIFAMVAVGLVLPAGAVQLTIAEKLEDIRNSKELIRQAIESQGVQVSSSVPLSQYGAKIRQIAATRFIGSSVDFCRDTMSSSTPLSINSIFSGICSPLSTTSKFPYTNCENYTPDSTGTDTYDWIGSSCPLVSRTATIYGNARCSTQRDTPGHGGNTSDGTANGFCFRATNEPSNNPGTGQYCWCQLCTDSAKTSCGGWVFRYVFGSAASCADSCAYRCGIIFDTSMGSLVYRAALCAAPAP